MIVHQALHNKVNDVSCTRISGDKAHGLINHPAARVTGRTFFATLVVLAEELKTEQIVTLDERGFRSYRHGRNRPFMLVLQEA